MEGSLAGVAETEVDVVPFPTGSAATTGKTAAGPVDSLLLAAPELPSGPGRIDPSSTVAGDAGAIDTVGRTLTTAAGDCGLRGTTRRAGDLVRNRVAGMTKPDEED